VIAAGSEKKRLLLLLLLFRALGHNRTLLAFRGKGAGTLIGILGNAPVAAVVDGVLFDVLFFFLFFLRFLRLAICPVHEGPQVGARIFIFVSKGLFIFANVVAVVPFASLPLLRNPVHVGRKRTGSVNGQMG